MTGAAAQHPGPLVELDVPALIALASLLETASVTASARALGRTQSSMSRTLARLRTLFGDPLLVPVGRTLRLTPRAEELRGAVGSALDGMRRLFAPARPASPRDERRSVRIAAADYTCAVLLDAWIDKLRSAAPGVVVQVTPVDASSIEPLARGELDLAIAPYLPGVGLDQFVAKKILEDRYVCVLRRGSPAARQKLGLSQYLALDHVMVGSVLPVVSSIDAALHARGATRKIAARMPSVLSALMLVAESDLAASSYARVVPYFAGRLVVRPLPFDVPTFELHLLWHPRETADPFQRWLREDLLAHAATLPRGRVTPRR